MIEAAGSQCILRLCDNRTCAVKDFYAIVAKDDSDAGVRNTHVAKDRQKVFRAWLRRGLEKPGKSQSGLARHLGMDDPSPINKVVAGTRRLQIRELIEASGYLEEPLPSDWPEASADQFLDDAQQGIPITAEVAAGLWLEVGSLSEESLGRLQNIGPIGGFPPEATFALRVRGNSVDRSAPHGSLLVCLDLGMSGVEISDGDLVIVQRTRAQESEREVTAKRVRILRNGIDLIPDSTDPKWKPIRFIQAKKHGDTSLTIVALVKQIITDPGPRK